MITTGYPPESPSAFHNPIISGFYPDPSICHVGDDYYTVHSSFEYFPGVPIFHSRDLVHWQQIGYCLTRTNQLNLDHARASGGIYAPTIRYHGGKFYMVTTLVDKGGNFLVTATKAAGPWSDPVWLDHDGIDPSLFFDDDGIVYYTRHQGMGDGSIAQCKLNLQTGKLESPVREIWKGTGGVWPEGPHLYKINGKYFLMIAEGGTSYDHRVTVARSDSPWGPFVSDPHNPILTHRDKPDDPFQALGHADLVETPAGWWMVCLGIRPQGGRFHHLGRESFLTSVRWTEAGWPEASDVAATMPAPKLRQKIGQGVPPGRDDFSRPQFAVCWNFLRNPHETDFSLTEKPGHLRLHGSPVTLNDQGSPAFVARRQTDLACFVSAKLAFNPQHENEEAGLVLRGNDKNHFEIGITLREGKRKVFLRKNLDGKITGPVQYEDLAPGNVILRVEASPLFYTFSCEPAKEQARSLGTAPTRDLASEKIGGFTGVFVGMYATGNGQKCSTPADFDWFEYRAGGR